MRKRITQRVEISGVLVAWCAMRSTVCWTHLLEMTAVKSLSLDWALMQVYAHQHTAGGCCKCTKGDVVEKSKSGGAECRQGQSTRGEAVTEGL